MQTEVKSEAGISIRDWKELEPQPQWFPLGQGAHLVAEEGGAQASPAAGAGSGDGQDNWKPFVLGKPGLWISEADKSNAMTEEGFSV